MERCRLICLIATLLLAVFASSCGPAPAEPTPAPTRLSTNTPPLTGLPTTASSPQPTVDFANSLEDFDPSNFTHPTDVNNKFFPLKPGTQFVFDGFTQEANRSVPHKIVYTITDLTKQVAGIRTVVVWILDYNDGNLVEAEIAFYAQDDDGNVWYLGEYPEVYENGQLVETPAWIPGFKGARAGIVMRSEPQPGAPSYSQGWGPAVGWADRGQVVDAGQQTCVPEACYDDTLVTEEFSQSEPDAFQVKYYAPQVGNIKVGWRGADASKETLELVELAQLSPEGMAQTRSQALELEKRAYSLSKEVYDQTLVSEYPVGTPAITIDLSQPPPVELPTAPVLSAGLSSEVVVYASDVTQSGLFELDYFDDTDSPGGKRIGLPNNGNELDPPPQNGPNATFKVKVQSGIPYRCWIHMKVGTSQASSQANLIWVQLSDAFDKANKEILEPGTDSYLTAQGPAQVGWSWVGCNLSDSGLPDPPLYFQTKEEITVRLQAGMEGVGFDQFLLSPAKYLNAPPSEPVVKK